MLVINMTDDGYCLAIPSSAQKQINLTLRQQIIYIQKEQQEDIVPTVSTRQFERICACPHQRACCCPISPAGGAVTLRIRKGLPSTLRPEKKVRKFLISGHSSSKPFQIMDVYNNMCDIKPIHCESNRFPQALQEMQYMYLIFGKRNKIHLLDQSTCSWLHRTPNQ